MVRDGRHGVLRRSLPVLLQVLVLAVAPLFLFARPPSEPVDPAAGSAPAVEPPADRVAALTTQVTAGASGCRAPPVTSV